LSRAEDVSEHDEENDPIIHSFGPFGENILPRMASFHAGDSPTRSPERKILKTNLPPQAVSTKRSDANASTSTIQNHIINQLAFSRLSSTPFSTILSNLPPGSWASNPSAKCGFLSSEIKLITETTQCIGEVSREGKDAAGKPLESEYYYIPDFDEDEKRKEAVVNDLMKPGLRNCRKQHKVRSFQTSRSLQPLTFCYSNITGGNPKSRDLAI
jgi:hypothetical protein